ncbi:carbonyl reductase [NADPH] 3-like [Amyelois transitella]|uniref:carbonyl reductase [NADPH] 3-like n=1 Tax=Amyelois transitella TaxID=680683 RepID=UPI00298FC4A9|nr:carbonyl reductase [NADPH] 3-like [Amyelois transitella]
MLKKVALVTDADQGIGIDLVKTLSKRFNGVFYFTSRDPEKGLLATAALQKIGCNVEYFHLDISDRESIIRFRDFVVQNYWGIDTLINNVAIDNGAYECESFEKSKRIVTDYYFNFVMIEELLFPLLVDNARVIYVSKQSDVSCVRNEYWHERLSMKHLREADINDFLVWYLEAIKEGMFNPADIVEDGMVAPYRVAIVALGLLVTLQRKKLQSRSICVEYFSPKWSFKNSSQLTALL